MIEIWKYISSFSAKASSDTYAAAWAYELHAIKIETGRIKLALSEPFRRDGSTELIFPLLLNTYFVLLMCLYIKC